MTWTRPCSRWAMGKCGSKIPAPGSRPAADPFLKHFFPLLSLEWPLVFPDIKEFIRSTCTTFSIIKYFLSWFWWGRWIWGQFGHVTAGLCSGNTAPWSSTWNVLFSAEVCRRQRRHLKLSYHFHCGVNLFYKVLQAQLKHLPLNRKSAINFTR